MKTLTKYILKRIIPVFFIALSVFILILELVDIFANIWGYINAKATLKTILTISLYHVPKCISYSLSLSLLFAISFVMGDMYSKNELTAIFSCGISLYRFSLPIVIFAAILSVTSFFLDDRVVIYTTKHKNELQKETLQTVTNLNNDNIVILSEDGTCIYRAISYDDTKKQLYDVYLVNRSKSGSLEQIIYTSRATWNEKSWDLESPTVYSFTDSEPHTIPFDKEKMLYTEAPSVFQRNIVNVDEMSATEAREAINELIRFGIPVSEQLSNYYKRYSYACTCLVVVILSLCIGGRFRKNVLLMSLLLSLATAVLFYITQMVTMLMAKWNYIPPIMGAWAPVIIFLILSSLLIKHIRT